MDLESGRPFWSVRNGLIRSYPRLQSRIAADVLIVGAGITGALIADELTRAGFQAAMLPAAARPPAPPCCNTRWTPHCGNCRSGAVRKLRRPCIGRACNPSTICRNYAASFPTAGDFKPVPAFIWRHRPTTWKTSKRNVTPGRSMACRLSSGVNRRFVPHSTSALPAHCFPRVGVKSIPTD